METQKTSITLTADELQVICDALNDKALDYMQMSRTWGTIEGVEKPDYFHRKALDATFAHVKAEKALKRAMSK